MGARCFTRQNRRHFPDDLFLAQVAAPLGEAADGLVEAVERLVDVRQALAILRHHAGLARSSRPVSLRASGAKKK